LFFFCLLFSILAKKKKNFAKAKNETIKLKDKTMEIYNAAGLRIELEQTITDEIRGLLWSMEWGTNGPIYQKISNSEKDEHIHRPHFLLLKKAGELLGMCTVSQRTMYFGGEAMESYYLQHFSIKKAHQGKRYSQLLIAEAKRYFEETLPRPFVGYAYIEGKNVRSQKAAKFIQYETVDTFRTIFFSRLFPKKIKNCRRLTVAERGQMLEKLHAFYCKEGFVHFTNTFHKDGYFVLERNGEIVAGVQASPVEWKILSMPHFSGKLIMNIVPKIPIINRLFCPQRHRFLVFDALYFADGKEQQLAELMQHVLAVYGLYSGLLWLDTKSEVFQRLDALRTWGILDRVEGKLPVTAIAKFHGLTAEQEQRYKSMPIYIAGFDSL
jgi:GNAT superfamily N-acetyltransferase